VRRERTRPASSFIREIRERFKCGDQESLAKIGVVFVTGFLFVALTAGSALASSVHFKKGSPRFTDNGVTLTASGAMRGSGTATCSSR
jgi:hypothetical protein